MASLSHIPKPHWLLFNPYLTTKEKIISFLIDFVFYMMNLTGLHDIEMGGVKCKKILLKARQSMVGMTNAGSKMELKNWLAATPAGLIAESSGSIPFRKNILREWNIIDEDTVLPDVASKDRKGVGVLVRFPASLLPDELKENGKILDDSECLAVDFGKVDWKVFSPEVPIIILFHGGGMNIGGPNDTILVEDMSRLIQNCPSQSSRDIITVSVDYSLAPEDPFPLGVMDALSVVDYFLRENSIRKGVHITGTSAGANLSLVCGFESFRRFPGRILSIQSQAPMLDPSSASMSYYMNQRSYPSVSWLRWSWQAYLGLEKIEYKDDGDNETPLEKLLRKDSNHTSWKKWKTETYPSEALHRLVNPLLGIPDGLNIDNCNDEGTKKPPTIIVRYYQGDPLYSDGKAAETALKPKTGSNANFYEELGLHCGILGPYNPDAPQEFWTVWSEALFHGGD